MFKNICKLSLVGLFLLSCSSADEQIEELISAEPTIINDENLTKLGLKISVDKNEGNIFEPFQFKLNQNNQSFYFGILEDHLDSLVFKMSDSQTTKKLFEKSESGNAGTFLFDHSFYYPGNYTARILGYKNSKVIYKDQVSVKVTDKNDFLTVNWNNFTPSNHSIGYHNSLLKNSLSIYTAFENGHPYVLIGNIWNSTSNLSADQINQKDRDYLYNFLVKFYSAPQYSEVIAGELKSVYLQNFKKTIDNDVPVNIWITAKNKIALMKEYSKTNSAQFYGYRVIAETNN